MAPLHRLPDPPHPGLTLPAAGGLQAEARRLGPPPGGPIGISPIGPRRRQAPRVDLGGGDLRPERADHQRLQEILDLATVIAVSPRAHHPEWPGPTLGCLIQLLAG